MCARFPQGRLMAAPQLSLLSCRAHLGLPSDRRTRGSYPARASGMCALGLAQARESGCCCRVAPFLREGSEMVTKQFEGEACSVSGRCLCPSQRGPG